ncbi:MAG: radical SAM family heme chaperone HemW [Peptococcaceae bacterium]|nr:radical SAM family heme chaperone HemW [Peptococcaceae bacterium]
MAGLYVHIPFCLRRCRYCSFFSSGGLGEKEQAAYVAALLGEGALYRRQQKSGLWAEDKAGVGFRTVYLGGGTPAYLTAGILARLLTGLEELFWPGGFSGQEFTVEANPGVLEEKKLTLLKAHGVTRLSLGAQSFDDRYLLWLGRSHNAGDFDRAWGLARLAGFTNLNLDLMYGLKDQSLEHWEKTLGQALSYRPEHISLYQLNVEEGTPLARELGEGAGYAAGEELGRRQFLAAHRILTRAGYLHYEISNYALPGRESRHNLLYWRRGCYLGLGAGAAGYLNDQRYTNVCSLSRYQKAVKSGSLPREAQESLTSLEKQEEALLLGLRLAEGLDLAAFSREFGVDLKEKCRRSLETQLRLGTLYIEGERLKPTLEGMLVNNEVIVSLLRELGR